MTGGVCGGLSNGDGRFTVGGQFATMAIAGKYTQGQKIDIKVQIFTNHVSFLSRSSASGPLCAV